MNDNIRIKYLSAIIDERHYPFYLLLISAFVLFFRLSGSIVGWDEGIYSQIAKEGLLSNNWTDLHYRDQLWFEKPPLVIWLTMISYKIFGINEFAIWFFPVVFGIIGILGTYYLAEYLFNPKIGFLSSLILLSIPHYVLMSRNNMTDIFLLTNSLLSFLFLPIFILYARIDDRQKIFKEKYFYLIIRRQAIIWRDHLFSIAILFR